MRHIRRIVIHCSATMPHQDIGVEQIDDWHKQRGWDGIGYHYVIRLDGVVEVGRPVAQVGAHARGYNSDSIGVCYVGGLNADGKPDDTRTPEQKHFMLELMRHLVASHHPAYIDGHKDLPGVNKACPCFDVKEWWNANS